MGIWKRAKWTYSLDCDDCLLLTSSHSFESTVCNLLHPRQKIWRGRSLDNRVRRKRRSVSCSAVFNKGQVAVPSIAQRFWQLNEKQIKLSNCKKYTICWMSSTGSMPRGEFLSPDSKGDSRASTFEDCYDSSKGAVGEAFGDRTLQDFAGESFPRTGLRNIHFVD